MDRSLEDSLQEIENRIALACASCGRRREDVTMVAVTKTVPAELICEAHALGVRHFGESKVQEAEPKVAAVRAQVSESTTWHFIGKLQSNKVLKAARMCQILHTIESASQLKELQKLDSPVDVFVEVNIGEEPQKNGISPSRVDDFVESVIQCDKARFRGLMAIGPANRNSEAMRPFFRRLRELNEKVGGTWLSIGMSSDFDVAIQEGATHIRVGSALFGARN
jgi:pyridoxal phosphate enzyme (YggS family)